MLAVGRLTLLALTVTLGVGMALGLIAKARYAQRCYDCAANMRMLGIGLLTYHDTYGQFPPGTLSNDSLPPDRRLSWYVESWAFVGDGQIGVRMDRKGGWDDEKNYEPKFMDHEMTSPEPLGHFQPWLCPANPARAEVGMAGFTHYVGVSGIGVEIGSAPKDYPLVGAFGYDRRIGLGDIVDGPSRTLLVVETATANGPWTRGGPSTVRALDPDRLPYLGPNGQFSSFHRPHVTHALFADGSVHALKESIDPRVFEALATIAGREEVGDDY